MGEDRIVEWRWRGAVEAFFTLATFALLPVAVVTPALVGSFFGLLTLTALLSLGTAFLVGRATSTGSVPANTGHTILAALPLVALYLVGLVRDPSPQGLEVVVQIGLAVTFLLGVSLVRWGPTVLRIVLWTATLVLAANAVWWLAAGTPHGFRGPTEHGNMLGLLAMHLAFFPLLCLARFPARRYPFTFVASLVGVASALVVLYGSTARASWLAAAVAVAVYVTWPWIRRRRARFVGLFVLLLLGCAVGTLVYVSGYDQPWGARIQELSLDLTGKRFYSGRQLFWSDLLDTIMLRPVWGYGAGTTAQEFSGFAWSSHNLYLQVALQTGFAGLLALGVFLTVVWMQLWPLRHDAVGRLAVAFLAGAVVHQVFEVSLLQNNLQGGVAVWLVVGIAMSGRRWRVG